METLFARMPVSVDLQTINFFSNANPLSSKSWMEIRYEFLCEDCVRYETKVSIIAQLGVFHFGCKHCSQTVDIPLTREWIESFAEYMGFDDDQMMMLNLHLKRIEGYPYAYVEKHYDHAAGCYVYHWHHVGGGGKTLEEVG